MPVSVKAGSVRPGDTVNPRGKVNAVSDCVDPNCVHLEFSDKWVWCIAIGEDVIVNGNN